MKTLVLLILCFMVVSAQARPLTVEETRAQSTILNLGERSLSYAVLGDYISMKLSEPVTVTKIERKLWDGAKSFRAQITLVHDNGSAAKCEITSRNDNEDTVIHISLCNGFMTNKSVALSLEY